MVYAAKELFRIKRNARISLVVLLYLLLMSFSGCSAEAEKELTPALLRSISFSGVAADSLWEVDETQRNHHWKKYTDALEEFSVAKHYQIRYNLRHDTMNVEILEFANPEAAYGFYLHTGMEASLHKWKVGRHKVRYFFAGKQIFRFDALQSRHLERPDLLAYIKQIAPQGDALPAIFSAFPRKNRIEGTQSIQLDNFLNTPGIGPVVTQSYYGKFGRYTYARTLNPVSDEDFNRFSSLFDEVRVLRKSWDERQLTRLRRTNENYYCVWSNGYLSFVYGIVSPVDIYEHFNRLEKLDFVLP
jgi:hypothetical protein